MANQMKHSGIKPENLFVVSLPEEKTFWVYMKEGHAINRMLKERAAGRTAQMIKFCEALPSEQVNV
jgi:hypothetical protein